MHQIRGTNFGTSDYACVFGDHEASATDAHQSASGLLECPIPPALNDADSVLVAGPTTLHIISAVGFSSNRLRFTYFAPPIILGVVPKFGPPDGGTRVLVTGIGFADYGDIACSFGGVAVPGNILSGTEVVCTSPAVPVSGLKAGDVHEVPLLVTVNGLHYSTNATGGSKVVIFEYSETPVVSFVSPSIGPPALHVKSGNRLVDDGQTTRLLRVHGAHFRNSTDLACRFGALSTAAAYVSPSEVDCVIPPYSPATGDSPTVSVSVNGVDFTREGPPFAMFTYADIAEVLGVSPSFGPAFGGTKVTVIGNNFANGQTLMQASLMCRFELVDATALNDNASELGSFSVWDVPANVASDSAATCVSPEVESTTASRIAYATVRVSADGGINFSTSAPRFTFYPKTVVSSVIPAILPASQGGTITISGRGFLPGTGLLHCWYDKTPIISHIGDQLEENTYVGQEEGTPPSFTTTAVWLSPELLRCEVPAVEVPAGASVALSVRVTNNGVDASSSAGRLLVYSSPVLSSFHPIAGPRTGGTTVNLTVDGWGLPEGAGGTTSVRCQWGTTLSTPGDASTANEDGRIFVTCTSPSAALVSTRHGSDVDDNLAVVALQVDGRNVSVATGPPFMYYDIPVVASASPSAGGEIGGTDVVLKGSGFGFGEPGAAGSGKTVCKFGDTTVAAAVVSDSELRCRSPIFNGGNTTPATPPVDLKVSLNGGVDFSPSSATFQYMSAATTSGKQRGGQTCFRVNVVHRFVYKVHRSETIDSACGNFPYCACVCAWRSSSDRDEPFIQLTLRDALPLGSAADLPCEGHTRCRSLRID